MTSSFGKLFRITTFGESHCKNVGVIVDGCPSNLELSEKDIQPFLDRRRPGQSHLTTPRDEKDTVTILSGVERGLTLGTPICLSVPNQDQRPGDYQEMNDIPRPSHADFTYQMKYGIRASSGGGRSSARETIGRVASAAIAAKYLKQKYGIEVLAWVNSVGNVSSAPVDMASLTLDQIEATPVRCPHIESAKLMEEKILETKKMKNSIGGTVACLCRNVPPGLGEPVFDKLEAKLAQAMLSIPASKGFEIGSGFEGTQKLGSEHNDPFTWKEDHLGTKSNHSGGIQGGISNGELIYFKVAFKPVATIGLAQKSCSFTGEEVTLEAKGRHDPCILPRAVPVVESMATLVLMDMLLRQKTRA